MDWPPIFAGEVDRRGKLEVGITNAIREGLMPWRSITRLKSCATIQSVSAPGAGGALRAQQA
jgi:hypothetical protein